MNNITLKEIFLLGNDDKLNDKLKLRHFVIGSVLLVYDAEDIPAEVVLVANTTKEKGTIHATVTCNSDTFGDELYNSIEQFLGEF